MRHRIVCLCALLFQNGTLDIYALPADGLRYQEAGSEPKTVRWYRVGHNLVMDGPAYRDQAECLSEMIGISVAAGGPSRSTGFARVCRPISVFKWSRDLRQWHTYLPPGTQ